ncbi:MAG: hypothetical protein IJA72_03655 [Clostridia bacterium]|nr:hypothetical protein [Clostridia bacterium]
MKDVLEIVGSRKIIDFVGSHKTRYNDIHLEKLEEDVVKITAELWGRYDDEDKEYTYYYGPYGELLSAVDSDSYVPFNDETKDWFKMVYGITKSEAYAKKFIEAHGQAIITKGKSDLTEIDEQIKQLEAKKVEITVEGNKLYDEMNAFVEDERKQAKKQNQEHNSLLVKAFFENMTEEEREEWLKQNGFASAKPEKKITSRNGDVKFGK